jgi:S-DNA-T family DNA segregation ATPase FtsK/SpoIIIE
VQRLTPAERLYGRLVVAGTTVWVVLADAAGPWTLGSSALWAAGLLAGGRPWWTSHRVRGRIRVDELVEAWPDWSRRAQLPGVRVISAQAGRVHDRLRLELLRGQQRARLVVDHLEDLASVRGIAPWRLRTDQQVTGGDPGIIDLLITHTDPWRDDHGRPIPLPHPAIDDVAAWCTPSRMADPIQYGVEAGAATASVALRNEQGGRFVAIASKKGGGKTVLLHDLLAGLCRMVDVDIAMVDCKEQGKASRPWAPRLIRRATTPAEAIDLLRWAAGENDRRGAASPDPVLQPTAQRRALVVIVDEYGALALGDERVKEQVEVLARKIRSASGGLVLADQRPDSSTWTGALRGQLDEVIVGRLENRRDAKAILPSVEGLDPTEFELPGQMVQQAGKKGRQIEARTWRLEDPVDIAAIVEACRDRWPAGAVEQVTPNTSRSTLEDTLELPRGAGAAQVREQIRDALNTIAGQDHTGVPDLDVDELRRRAQAQPPAEPTEAERTLDERIMTAIRDASPAGIAMGDLELAVQAPRSTVQVRCAALRRQGRVHTDPPRGRHARWHITVSDQPAMANA